MSYQWDVLVVGAGPGGYVAAIRAAQLGQRTAIIEREHIGGVCLNWGCIPTKALVHSISLYQEAREARQHGVIIDSVNVDLQALVKRSRTVSERISKGVAHLLKKSGVEIINGEGRLLDPHSVEVNHSDGARSTITSRGIILATGGRAKAIPGLSDLGSSVMGVREAMTPQEIPERLLIIGAGAIGVEFAYIYAVLGAKVILVEMLDQLLPAGDHDASAEIFKAFRRLKIESLVSTRLVSAELKDSGAEARLQKGDEEIVKTADKIFVAVGVDPNSENLGLDTAGIATNRGFVRIDEKCFTGVEEIYAVGDLVGGPLLAHKASAEGMVAAEALAGISSTGIDYGLVPACCYCEPQVAQVGATERQLIDQGMAYTTGMFPLAANSMATAFGKRNGFVKLLFAADHGPLLGAHLVGPYASEIITSLAFCLRDGKTAHEIGSLVHPHPSLSEAVMEAAHAADGKAIHA